MYLGFGLLILWSFLRPKYDPNFFHFSIKELAKNVLGRNQFCIFYTRQFSLNLDQMLKTDGPSVFSYGSGTIPEQFFRDIFSKKEIFNCLGI